MLVVALASTAFYNGTCINQNARLDAIYTFVEPGPHRFTFRIDPFLPDPGRGINTVDWAQSPVDGHFYANKAPGTILLGTPVYAVLWGVERALGVDPAALLPVILNAWLIHILVTIIPFVLSSGAFATLVYRLTAGNAGRTLALTVLLYLGTPALPFATMLWGHATAMAFVVFALASLLAPRPGFVAVGFFLGMAVLTDYAALTTALLVVAFTVWQHGWRAGGRVVAGGLGPAIVFAAYHAWCFGSPLALASSFSNPVFLAERDVGGLFRSPSLPIALKLLGAPELGLFWYAPPLLLVFSSVWFALRDAGSRPLALLCLAQVTVLLAFNSSFGGWHGGLAFGPRYLVVAFPFWVLLLEPASRWVVQRLLFAALLAMALLTNALGAVFVPCHATFGSAYQRALLLPTTTDLDQIRFVPPLPHNANPGDETRDGLLRLSSWNVGELLGLRGGASLLPIILAALGSVVMLGRVARSSGRKPTHPTSPDDPPSVSSP